MPFNLTTPTQYNYRLPSGEVIKATINPNQAATIDVAADLYRPGSVFADKTRIPTMADITPLERGGSIPSAIWEETIRQLNSQGIPKTISPEVQDRGMVDISNATTPTAPQTQFPNLAVGGQPAPLSSYQNLPKAPAAPYAGAGSLNLPQNTSLTPEQINAYYKSQSSLAKPLSPSDWLKQQSTISSSPIAPPQTSYANPTTPTIPIIPSTPAPPISTGNTPTVPTTGTPSSTIDTTSTSNKALKDLLTAMTPSPEVADLYNQNLQIEAQRRQFHAAEVARSRLGENAIATPFIMGQENANNAMLDLKQAPIQASLQAAQYQQDLAIRRAQAAADYYNKTFEIPLGGTLAQRQSDGKIVPVISNNPYANPLIATAIQEGRLTSADVSRYGAQAILATLQQDPNFNFITNKASSAQKIAEATVKGSVTKDAFGNIVQVTPTVGGKTIGGSSAPKSGGITTSFPKADQASLQQQTIYADNTERAFNTANNNLKALVAYMNQAGVNKNSTIPIINALTNKFKGQLSAPGIIAGYHAALAGLRAEYAQVLSRGGEVTEGQRTQAASLIPDNLTPVQLQQVTDRLTIEGINAIKEARGQIQAIKDRISGKSNLGTGGQSNVTPSGNTFKKK